MSEVLLYYAYGSNLHPARLKARIPSSQLLGAVTLPNYQLAFHKRGADGSGKCNALFSGDPQHQLPGALFQLLASERPILDEIEGAGYCVETVMVNHDGAEREAFAYVAEDHYIDNALKPYHWYKAFVSLGAQYHGFPPYHLEQIERIESIADADYKRQQKNAQILALMR